MKNFRSVLLPLFFFAMVPIAKAGLLTFQFTGTVTQVPIDDLYGDIAFGDFVYGTYTFDGSAPDLVPGDPSIGSYASPGPMIIAINGHGFNADAFVNVGVSHSFIDQYSVFAQNVPGLVTLGFLLDGGNSVFADDSLPLTPPLLSAFPLRDLHIQQTTLAGEEVQIDGVITDIIDITNGGPGPQPAPEPGTGLIVCSAIAALALFPRFRSHVSRLRGLSAAAFLIGAASSAYAVDGVVLIDQAQALAGNITPGDAPGFPITIMQPGSYRLSGNITVPSRATNDIEIFTSNVTIDLNGFSIVAPPFFPQDTLIGGSGVFSPPGSRAITLRNGTITGWVWQVNLSDTTQVVARNLITTSGYATSNGTSISVGESSILDGVNAQGSGGMAAIGVRCPAVVTDSVVAGSGLIRVDRGASQTCALSNNAGTMLFIL